MPLCIAGSVAAYLLGSMRLTVAAGAPRLSRTSLGHWAGIANYAIVGLSTGPGAIGSADWTAVLLAASVVVIAINLAAVGSRLIR